MDLGRVYPEQGEEVLGGVERVGDRPLVGQRQRGAGLAVRLGDQDGVGEGSRGVQRGEADQGECVDGLGQADRDLSVGVPHLAASSWLPSNNVHDATDVR
jgi:hypothetical protein